MKFILPILFALIAASGNAMFAYFQKQTAGMINGLVLVGSSAMVACLLSLLASPMVGGPINLESIRQNFVLVIFCGVGLFLTYLGINLLYSNFGVSPYVLYAVISIVTTTVVVGFILLKEPINAYHMAAVVAAIVTVILFSIGQSKS